MKKSWSNKLARRKLDQDVKEDLEFWKLTLESFKHLRLIASPMPLEIGWVGDASTSYGIGILVGSSWSQFHMTDAWKSADEDHKHINFLETVAIRLGLLMALAIDDTPGRNLVVWTDNTTAQAAVTNRRSKNRAVNDEWKVIQTLLITSQLDIAAKRVTSADNAADQLSRGLRGDCLPENRLRIDLPPDLSTLFVNSP